MKIRRLLSVFLLAALLCGLFTVPAAALEDPDIRAKAALLVALLLLKKKLNST